jgi:hypothetical protein
MTAELFTALAAANATLTNPGKDGKGNYGAYLTLDTLLDHVRPILAAHGLSIVQDVILEAERVQIVTQLLHASGESVVFGPLSGPAGANWQQLGGAISYGRRYALLAALGIAGGDDDDAQGHTDANPGQSGSRAVRATSQAGRATEKQIAYLTRLMRDQHITEYVLNDFAKDRFGWELPTDGIAHLSKDHAGLIIDALTAQAKADGAKTTRSKPKEPDPDDPWSTAPLVDPETGEAVL